MNAPLEEPLAESAPLAWRLAPQLCRIDPATGESCAWFHRVWQILRLLGINTTPEHHERFFSDALGSLRKIGSKPKILISGTADYALLARLLPSFGRSPAAAWTVLDHCETPLALNRWYAERTGNSISTRCCDILEFEEPGAYDAICTHSFIGQFPPELRAALIRSWQRLLRPGGLLVTVNRLRPGAGTERIGFSPAQAAALVKTVMKKAESLSVPLGAAPAEIEEFVGRYASRMGAWPVHSEAELRELFGAGGFAIEQLSSNAVAGGHAGISGPTAIAGAQYACIVARRAP